MIDSLRAAIPRSKLPDDVELKQFALVTLHRPSNVDSPDALGHVLKMIGEVANRCRSCDASPH
jgi:hypothetical protein